MSWIDELSTTELVIGAAAIAGALGYALRDREGLGFGPKVEKPTCGYAGPPPAPFRGVPYAVGDKCPLWPLISRRKRTVSYRMAGGGAVGNWARRFGADRGSRFHAGMDLYANPGDPIVAMEDGRVVAFKTFFDGTWALYLCTNTGITINYGEIEKNSWKKLEKPIQRGSIVRKGQMLGRVGRAAGGSHMLHLETYRGCVNRNYPWYKSRGAPAAVLNPTKYLLRARDAVPGGQV